MNIEKLKNEKINLSAMKLDLDDEISSTQKQVEDSFLGSGDTDKISQKLVALQSKRGSLTNAINSAEQAIKQAQLDIISKAADKALLVRKESIKIALSALDDAHDLQIKLADKLQIVSDEAFKANPNNQEITLSIRGLVGKLAQQFKLANGLQHATGLKILSSKNDLLTQQANLK